MNDQNYLPKVDQSAIKVSQGSMITLLIVAFVLDVWPIVAVVAVLNALGALAPPLDLYRQVYLRLLKPLDVVQPNVISDHPEPHRFAKGVGAVLAALSVLALGLGLSVLGWVLTWVLILLAAVNLFAGFCLGCFFYYQFSRLGVPGFTQRPIEEG